MTLFSGFVNRTNFFINTYHRPFIIHLFSRARVKAKHHSSSLSGVYVVQRLILERLLPNLAEADGRVEAVENGERHRDVRDDRPHPLAAVEVDLDGVRVRPVGLQGVDRPHGEVADQEEGHDLPARLLSHLFLVVCESARGVSRW